MYIFDEMIEMPMEHLIKAGKATGWTSEDHKYVAQKILLSNPAITDMDNFIRCTEIINNIPQDRIRLVTLADLIDLGISMNFN